MFDVVFVDSIKYRGPFLCFESSNLLGLLLAVGVQEFKIGFEETNADALASRVVIFIDFVPYFAEIKVLGRLRLIDNLVRFDTGVKGF